MDLQSPDDRQLIENYLNGDDSAFTSLYERYKSPVFAHLNRMLPGQSALVDDLFQQAWVKVISKLPEYRDQQTFLAWVLRIAHNLGIDHFRRQTRRPTDSLDAGHDRAGEGPMPHHQSEIKDLASAVAAAVSQLPEEQRAVFLLRQEGVAFKEIAEIQGTNVNTALGRMHYAINKLRATLKDWR